MNFLYLYLVALARVLYSVCVIIYHKNCFRRLSDCVLGSWTAFSWRFHGLKSPIYGLSTGLCTDRKENQSFLIYKEIQNGAFAKSYMTNGLLIYGCSATGN